MEETLSIDDAVELLEAGFTFEVTPLSDAPLAPGDRVVYTEPYPGRVLVARSPIILR